MFWNCSVTHFVTTYFVTRLPRHCSEAGIQKLALDSRQFENTFFGSGWLHRGNHVILVRSVTLGFPRIYPRDADTARANMHHRGTRAKGGYVYTGFLSSFRIALKSRPAAVLRLTSLYRVACTSNVLVCAFVTSVCLHLYPPSSATFVFSSAC